MRFFKILRFYFIRLKTGQTNTISHFRKHGAIHLAMSESLMAEEKLKVQYSNTWHFFFSNKNFFFSNKNFFFSKTFSSQIKTFSSQKLFFLK